MEKNISAETLTLGQTVFTKPIKDFKKVNHDTWEVKAVYKDCGDGNGVGYLLVSNGMHWIANHLSVIKSIFINREDISKANIFVA